MVSPSELAIYKRHGAQIASAPALVLLPAFPFDHRMWEGVARRFEGIPVIAVDPPGFGHSPALEDSPSLELYADLVAHAVRAAGVTSAVVAGNTMGGYTALAMVERHPRLVRGLALIGSDANIDSPTARGKRTEMAITAFLGRAQTELAEEIINMVSIETAANHPEMVKLLREWVNDTKDDAIAWAQRAMAQRPGRLEMLTRAKVEGAVIRGEQDRYTSASQADQVARALDEAYVTNVPRAGQLVPVEQPGAVARALLNLYNRCR